MNNNEFNADEFRRLLRKGIGLRTQKEFAEKTGIAPATISRMLNDPMIACPRIKTLEVLASAMVSVSFSELMLACGYEVESVEDKAASMESDISDFFAFRKSDTDVSIFTDMDELTRKLCGFTEDRFSNVKATVKNVTDTDIPERMNSRGAEEESKIWLTWDYDVYFCRTSFSVYYLTAKSGKIVVVGTDIDEETEKGHTVFRKKNECNEAEKLLRAIFGNVYGTVPAVYAGHGFEVQGTPAGFADFLQEHASTFCDSGENTQMYQEFIEGADPEIVFANYEDLGGSIGCCAVISDIMRKESGEEYLYYEPDEKVPESERNACILCRHPYDSTDRLDNDTLIYLYRCAKTLGVEKFGITYYLTTCEMKEDYVYSTDSFWLT